MSRPLGIRTLRTASLVAAALVAMLGSTALTGCTSGTARSADGMRAAAPAVQSRPAPPLDGQAPERLETAVFGMG